MKNRYDESNKVTITSIILNCLLTIFKVIAGTIGNSTAMIADGFHSASDVISSVVILIGNYIAQKPEDKEHNYGHEKAETVVSALLSILLIVVSIQIGYQGIILLFNIEQLKTPTMLPLIAAIFSILVKEYQYQITIKIAKKTNSPALKADAWHHRSDAFTSIAAFIGIIGGMFGFKILDPIVTIFVAIFILKIGYDILKKSINELLDVSIEQEEISNIMSIVEKSKEISSVKTLKSRKYGPLIYLDIEICVDGNISVKEGHDIATSFEEEVKERLGFVKGIIIHVEPIVIDSAVS